MVTCKKLMGKSNCVKNWEIEIYNVDSMPYYHKIYIADHQYTDPAVTGLATFSEPNLPYLELNEPERQKKEENSIIFSVV